MLKVSIGKRLFPIRIAVLVILAELVHLCDQCREFVRLFPVFNTGHHLVGRQVGFDDVFGRGQDIRNQVLSQGDGYIKRAVDFNLVQAAQRKIAKNDKSGQENSDQQRQLGADFEIFKLRHNRPSTRPALELS